MQTGKGRGILTLLRGDGAFVRALLLALALQILAPTLGMFPAAATPADAIPVCTAHGVATLVPDGQGGWTEQAAPGEAGLSCSFCLPLLSGNLGAAAEPVLPPPLPEAEPVPVLAQAPPIAATAPGSFSPRAPPVLR